MKTDNLGNVEFSGKLYSGPALTGLNFGQALEYLKIGKKVKRAPWGGYWFIPASEPYIESEKVPMKPMIVACLKDNGGLVPATAYQGDLLAEDWELVE